VRALVCTAARSLTLAVLLVSSAGCWQRGDSSADASTNGSKSMDASVVRDASVVKDAGTSQGCAHPPCTMMMMPGDKDAGSSSAVTDAGMDGGSTANLTPCTSDTECAALPGFVCTEQSTGSFCQLGCQRDADCALLPNTVCAIANNTALNRIDAYCRAPYGSTPIGDSCFSASDCAHGTCAIDNSGASPVYYCTELCTNSLDCTGSNCVTIGIARPVDHSLQSIQICDLPSSEDGGTL
jgi:hypothetical protein